MYALYVKYKVVKSRILAPKGNALAHSNWMKKESKGTL